MPISFRMVRNIGLLVMVMIITIMGGIFFAATTRIVNNIDGALRKEKPVLELVERIRDCFLDAREIFSAFARLEKRDITLAVELMNQAVKESEKLKKLIPENKKEVDEFLIAAKRFRVAVVTYAEEVKVDITGARAIEMEKIARVTANQAEAALARLARDTRAQISFIDRNVLTISKNSQNIVLIGVLIGIGAGLLVVFFMGRGLRRPINELVHGAQRIAKGDLDYRVKVESRDEIGQFSEAFNKMAEDLRYAQKELRSSEDRLKILFKNSPDAIFMADLKGVFVEINETAEILTGYKKEELCGKSFLNFPIISPDQFSKVAVLLEKVIVGQDVGLQELILVRKDGRQIPIEIQIHLIKLKGQLYVLGSSRDITQRKEMEEGIRRSQYTLSRQNKILVDLTDPRALQADDLKVLFHQLTKILAETLNIERVSIWLFDERDTKLCCHDLFELNKNSHSEGTELPVTSFPAYFQALREVRVIDADDAHTDPRTKEFSSVYLTPLGISSMLDVPISRGDQLRGVICQEHVGLKRTWSLEEKNFAMSIANLLSMSMESHERKYLEQRLRDINDELEVRVEQRTLDLEKANQALQTMVEEQRRTEEALRDSEDRYKRITSSVTDYIYTVRLKEGRAEETAHGAGCLMVTGYTAEEFVSHPLLWITIIPKEDQEIVKQQIENIYTRRVAQSIEHRIIRKDGGICWVKNTPVLYFDGQHRLVGYDGVVKDITAIKEY
ncbi:MAG: PAS domain S-box protein, partial [Candidatus Omnitrophota bacterium]